jgi:8-oxo-dGTP pyrophosphatase MutT (NUDIX family)
LQTPSLEIVRGFIDVHKAQDVREVDSLRRIHDLVKTASAPFSRQHFMPGHLTASAMVFEESREKTLLIFHGKLKRWLQPGGHFEPGENDPSVAAAREVLEETGLKCRWPGPKPQLLDVDVHEIPARKDEPLHCHFDLRMLVLAEGQEIIGDGVSDIGWFTRAQCETMDLDPGLFRGLMKVWSETK